MPTFDHEKLDVYQAALVFLVWADAVAAQLARHRYYMADQLRRAALSVGLNIAEGAAEFSKPDKRRFYRFARRSMVECVALIQSCQRLEIRLPDDTPQALGTADRVVAMLTVLTLPKRIQK